MSIGIQTVRAYLARYIEEYQKEYSRLVSPPPSGGGYPQLEVSPYLYSKEITCWITENGTVICDESREPGHSWWIAGGPTLVVDIEPSRTPPEVIDLLKREGLSGKNIGMYRIVAKQGIFDDIWNGYLGPVIEEDKATVKEIPLSKRRFFMSWHEAFNQSGFSKFLNGPAGRAFRLVAGTGFLVVGYLYRDHALGVLSMAWSVLPLSAGALDICFISAVLGGPLSGAKIRGKYK